MKLSVPFAYEAVIQTLPDESKTIISVLDSVDVELRTGSLDAFTRVLQAANVDYLSNGSQLIYAESPATKYFRVDAGKLEKGLNNVSFTNPFEPNPESPTRFFSNYFTICKEIHSVRAYISTLQTLARNNIKRKEDMAYTNWVIDSRDEVIKKIQNIADNLIVLDGVVHKEANEPFYFVSPNSADDERIHLYCSDHTSRPEEHRNPFRADEYPLAKEYALMLQAKRPGSVLDESYLRIANNNAFNDKDTPFQPIKVF